MSPGPFNWLFSAVSSSFCLLRAKKTTMKEFTLPFKPEELAKEDTFSLLFAVLQAWPRLDESLQPRVVDLLADAAKRLVAEAGRLRGAKSKERCRGRLGEEKSDASAKALRNVCKVSAFFLRWTCERLLSAAKKRPGRTRRGKAEQQAAAEEAKEASKALERQRALALNELHGLLARGPGDQGFGSEIQTHAGALSSLFATGFGWRNAHPIDPMTWKERCLGSGSATLLRGNKWLALKGKETKQAALQCIAVPLLQEGQQHSNLLVATVSKLLHGLRGAEGTAAFAAECLLQAHTTPLPRLFLVELTQHCTAQELTSQGAFQRSLAAFLVALSERLPHVVLANISVLLPLLDVDCYPIRQAIVESIGQLLAAEGRQLPSGAHAAQPEEEGGEDPRHIELIAELETLFTRFLDKSVWVRYRVLQTLNNLASNNGLPRELWPRVLDLAIRRMQDTASMSRKAAMQLVRKLVEFHPYGPALKGSGDERAKAEKLLNEIQERLKKLKAEELAELEGAELEGAELEAAEPAEKRRRCKGKTETDVSIAREVDKDLNAQGEDEEPTEDNATGRHVAREKQREALQRMEQCYAQRVHFVELLDAAEARLRALLGSKTATDVTEAIGVVVELRLRGVPAAAKAFHQVLGLVWSRHAPIKDAAVDAFYRMHLEGRDVASAAQAMLDIYKDGFSSGTLTHTHLASAQELIQQAAEKELIVASQVIPTMLSALSEPGSAPCALRALTALSASGHEALSKAMPKLQEFVVQRSGSPAERLESCRLVCQLLLRFLGSAKTAVADSTVARLCAVSQECSCVVVQHFVKGDISPQWFPAAMCAMDPPADAAHRSPDKARPSGELAGKSGPVSLRRVWENIFNRMICGILGGQSEGAAWKQDVQDDGEIEAGLGTTGVWLVLFFCSAGMSHGFHDPTGATWFVKMQMLRIYAFLSLASLIPESVAGARTRELHDSAAGVENGQRRGNSSGMTEGCRRDKTCDVYDCHTVTIPSVSEITELNDKLQEIHEHTLGSHQVLTHRESLILRTSLRLAMLAYGRNDGKGLSYHELRTEKEVSMLELQFKSFRHKEHKTDDTAHLVAYLFKVQGSEGPGVGIALSYKGSTNLADWKANMATWPRSMFPTIPELKNVKVHRGFLAHKRRLDARMSDAPMAPLKTTLAKWGVETSAKSFREFLLAGQWSWLLTVGHSLGGAMAAISGLELAVHTSRAGQQKQVHVVGVGTAIPGNQKFSDAMDGFITPKGGLRIANDGDNIPFMGYGLVWLWRSTRVVHGYEWILPHLARKRLKKLKMHIQYDIFDWATKPARFVFPKVGQSYTSKAQQLGSYTDKALGVKPVAVPQLGAVAFVAGHLALRMLIFLEGLQSALKRKRMAQEEAKMAEQREKTKEKKVEKAETSMGGVGLEEREAEAFAQLAESGLLYSNRLLDRVKPLLFACLLDKELRGYPLIRRVGAISLCKFMTVSKRFCEENLQLLFSVLFPRNGKSQLSGATQDAFAEGGLLEDLTLRQSLLVAVGDLLFRHPNVVEPWSGGRRDVRTRDVTTGRLYATLSAPAEETGSAVDLRLTALLVLTHLVLNDMMKPRPVLLIRALWLTACKHEATARVARILFQELAKRSTNVVYNLLPEIVARLPEHVEPGVEGGAVARVQYIMQFVEKEKHIEGLIEKFTLRLEQCASGAGAADAEAQEDGEAASPARVEEQWTDGCREWRDTVACLAHALGAMSLSDRCVLRLHDVVVTRKALNLALSYYPVARECLLAVVEPRSGMGYDGMFSDRFALEKARKPRGKGEEEPKADGAGDGAAGGKAGSAAQAALDAMEQLVNTLAHGKEDLQAPRGLSWVSG
ncbi:unnamed protein product [Durusdinium trenchii]|uniref:Non-specific serine/threonine protein kinase n=1 Tax=Durusdinium trenchii TaxID=1381693 RepID=A0ABP0PTR2_9DINO